MLIRPIDWQSVFLRKNACLVYFHFSDASWLLYSYTPPTSLLLYVWMRCKIPQDDPWSSFKKHDKAEFFPLFIFMENGREKQTKYCVHYFAKQNQLFLVSTECFNFSTLPRVLLGTVLNSQYCLSYSWMTESLLQPMDLYCTNGTLVCMGSIFWKKFLFI